MVTVKNVAVIGAGFMGSSIALLCAQNKIRTINIDVSEAQIKRAKAVIEKAVDKLVDKGKLSIVDAAAIGKRLTYSTVIQNVKHADIVIEAVSENFDLKKRLIEQIEAHASKDAIILSNTSSLSISKIVKQTARPDRIMCAHFFSPPTVMKLVELIRGEKTSDETYARTLQFVEQIDKQAVNAPELPGFIVNRLLIPVINDAAFLLMQGAQKEDIDKAMKLGANHKMGPLELGDFVGLDVVLAIMETLHEGLSDDKYRPCPLIGEMVEQGKLGRKTKKGFYTY